MFDAWAFLECSVYYRLGGNSFPTSTALVARDENARLAVKDSVTKGFGTESSEDNRVYGTKASASKESSDCLPSHRQVYGNGISFLDAEALEDVRDRANLTKKFGIRDETPLSGLIGLINDGSLKESTLRIRSLAELTSMTYPVGVLVCPSIDAVIGSIQGTLREPDDVSCFKSSSPDTVEGAVPVQGFSRNLGNQDRSQIRAINQ